MRRVTCQCGQSFFPFLTNGVPREACPFCKTKLTLNSDGTLAGTTPAAAPPSQRVSELQPPEPQAPPRPPARYACEVSTSLPAQEMHAQAPPFGNLPVSPAQRDSAVNMWRDRKRIVVLGEWFNFPPVCVLTGRTDNLVSIPQTVKFLPYGWLWIGFFGLLGAAIGQAIMGTTLNLSMPVSSEYLAKKRHHFLIGVWIAFISGFLFVIACFVFIGNWREKSDHLMVPMLLTMIGGFAGLIYMAVTGSHGRLVCNRMEGNCMWLKGASPEFLKHLPEWSTTGPRGAPGVKYRS